MDIVTEHSDKVTAVDGETVIRDLIQKYPDEQGKLWVKISDYFTRRG
jgi:hypothetical protein